MSRIDHAAVAHEILAHTPTNGGVTYSDWMAEAQVHATLALVEQQRIANLIALSKDTFAEHEATGALGDFAGAKFGERIGLRPEIAAALGIETGATS